MQGQAGATGPLPEALEFEGQFMSSRPTTNNPFWWHHEQSPPEQQLPEFIPIPNDTGANHHITVGQSGWNAERLNLGLSNSSNMKTGSGYSDQLIENGRTSSLNAYAGAGSASNNLPYPPIIGTYQGSSNGSSTHESNHNLIRPVIVQNSRREISMRGFLTNAASSGHGSTEHFATDRSSANPSMDFFRTGSLFREENIDGTESTVVSSHSSDKRKSPEGSWDESSASASKRPVQVAGSSGLQAAPSSHISGDVLSVSSSSANVIGLRSSATLRLGTVLPARSSLFDNPPEPGMAGRAQNNQQNIQTRTNTSLQDSLPTYSVLSSTDTRHNSYPVVQRPRLVLPPPLGVGEGSNVQNHQMPVHYPVTPQQSVQLTRHHNASSIIPRNSSGSSLAMHTTQMGDMGLRNSTQSLQLPVIAPPVGSRNSRRNAMNISPSGGDAIIPDNAALGSLSDPIRSLPQPVPNLVFNGNRRRISLQIRQALLAADSLPGASNSPPQEIGLQSVVNSHGTQTLEQRATLLQTPGHNHSNFGAPTNHNTSAYSFDTETTQRFLARARHIISIYRGGRDIQALEDDVNVRQSLLSALVSIHDQHRDMRLDVDNMSYEELLELGERIGNVKTGLSEETIMKCLKHTQYNISTLKSDKPVAAEPCSICQEEYAEGEELGALDCGHEYHTICIKQWLLLKNSCPICKAAASSSK